MDEAVAIMSRGCAFLGRGAQCEAGALVEVEVPGEDVVLAGVVVAVRLAARETLAPFQMAWMPPEA